MILGMLLGGVITLLVNGVAGSLLFWRDSISRNEVQVLIKAERDEMIRMIQTETPYAKDQKAVWDAINHMRTESVTMRDDTTKVLRELHEVSKRVSEIHAVLQLVLVEDRTRRK